MNNNKGFTLIELVIVIVILGILAATAAPKFIDLTGDARESVMAGVQGSVNSAVDMTHAKALIEGATSANDEISAAGITVVVTEGGWPNGDSIVNLIELDSDTDISVSSAGATASFNHDGAATPANCGIVYDASSTDANTRPLVNKTATFEC